MIGIMLTLGRKMPPSGIEGIISSPSVNILTVRLACAVLVDKGGPELNLSIKAREGAHVALPCVSVENLKRLQ